MTTTHGAGDRHAGRDGATDDRALLGVDDVARLLAVSTRTIRRMADSGQMPRPVRVASLVRWRARTGDAMTGLLDWVDAGCPSCRPSRRRAGR